MTFESWIILSLSVFAISESVQQESRDSSQKTRRGMEKRKTEVALILLGLLQQEAEERVQRLANLTRFYLRNLSVLVVFTYHIMRTMVDGR